MKFRVRAPLLIALLFAAPCFTTAGSAQIAGAAPVNAVRTNAAQPSQCEEAFALWDDVAADPTLDVHPSGKARKRLVRGAALCQAGDTQGAELLLQALALIGVTVD